MKIQKLFPLAGCLLTFMLCLPAFGDDVPEALRPPKGAPVALVVFEDLQCPQCGRVAPVLDKASHTYKIPLVQHDFPLPMHNWSFDAAVLARYFDTHSKELGNEFRLEVFQHQPEILPNTLHAFAEGFAKKHQMALPFAVDPDGKLAALVKADKDLGMSLKVQHTPTVYIVSGGKCGKPYVEVTDTSQLYQTIDAIESQELECVLSRMDASAKDFKCVEANVVWNEYNKVVNETDVEKGKVYVRREKGEIQMAVDFLEPDKKYVRYTQGKVQIYQPAIDQINEYVPGKNRGEVESFLVLGFGGSGHDLPKSYTVKFVKTETVDGVAADQLELIPKSDRLRNNISRILLWIDSHGFLVQQQLFEPGGDYRLAKYSDIKPLPKLPDSVFKLKTTSKTKVVTPQG